MWEAPATRERPAPRVPRELYPKIQARWPAPERVELSLDPAEARGGDRDFVLRYRLAGDQIQSGLLLHRGEEESFFLLMVQPPRRVVGDDMPPREYVFVVDVSGSMNSWPVARRLRI